MRTLLEYLDAAIERQQLGSDRQLSRLFGHTGNTVSQFRTGKSLPSPETMVKLADLAGISREQALLELSYWNAEGDAKATYEKLIKRLGVTAAALAALIFVSVPKAYAEPACYGNCKIVYITENIRNYITKLLRFFNGIIKPFQRCYTLTLS